MFVTTYSTNMKATPAVIVWLSGFQPQWTTPTRNFKASGHEFMSVSLCATWQRTTGAVTVGVGGVILAGRHNLVPTCTSTLFQCRA